MRAFLALILVALALSAGVSSPAWPGEVLSDPPDQLPCNDFCRSWLGLGEEGDATSSAASPEALAKPEPYVEPPGAVAPPYVRFSRPFAKRKIAPRKVASRVIATPPTRRSAPAETPGLTSLDILRLRTSTMTSTAPKP